ncbi:uncharacterized protein LOC143659913 [Tamandua tetradactyla]|uniref:uncharacterized protein LOC143659913 n=1 Tax=Tamandua tetradactyla TaxID=48850 RepID=UPI0040546611
MQALAELTTSLPLSVGLGVPEGMPSAPELCIPACNPVCSKEELHPALEADMEGSIQPQVLSAEPCYRGSSLPSVRLQLGCDLSSGVAAVSLPGRETDASKSDLEMSVGLISKNPDGQEKQINCYDRALAVILKALDEDHLDLEAVKGYKLVKIISPD